MREWRFLFLKDVEDHQIVEVMNKLEILGAIELKVVSGYFLIFLSYTTIYYKADEFEEMKIWQQLKK